jgi:hypothetical protein
MSRRQGWLSFERQGGRRPADDEELLVAENGAFRARRTVGGRSIGTFEGVLPAAALRRLRTAVDALAGASNVEIPTPGHGATEVLAVAGLTLTSGSNETAPRPWRTLQRAVRRLLQDEVIDHPSAALTLVADRRRARLEHAGEHEIDLDRAGLQISVVHVGPDEAVVDRWSAGPAGSEPDRVTARPGWRLDLPFDHGFRLRPGAWLQVRVEVPIRLDRRHREGRLYVPVLTDG